MRFMADARLNAEPKPLPAHSAGGERCGEDEAAVVRPRYWLRITGLPGWRRRELGLPSFGRSLCSRHLR
jgi:hypothetical protein